MDRLAIRHLPELEGHRWIRSIWPGKLILKGILDVEDAEEAAKTGAQALVVSNHGGRQLDGAPSSIEILPEVVDAVGSQMEIMFDGGIRSGQDVMRALALGAKSCMIGRAFAYGLGAGGRAGVDKAIDLIRNELNVTMGLCGVNTIAEIDDKVIAM
jgi:L-lactate dehydrogenase (cytochrome)